MDPKSDARNNSSARKKLQERINKIKEQQGNPTQPYVESTNDPYKLPESTEIKGLYVTNSTANQINQLRYLENPSNSNIIYYTQQYPTPETTLGRFKEYDETFKQIKFDKGTTGLYNQLYYNTPAPTGGKNKRSKKFNKRSNKRSKRSNQK
jgi:hypothetical protein